MVPLHDQAIAAAFLKALDPEASNFTFQFFSDGKDQAANSQNSRYAEIIHGTLLEVWPKIVELNNSSRRIGVFVTINETDLNGRHARNVVRARALFVDADSEDQTRNCYNVIESCNILPTMIVRTSACRAHFYWVCQGLELVDFSNYQAALIAKMGTDPSIKDLSRVMRLPGTIHLKNVECPFLVTLEMPNRQRAKFDISTLAIGFGLEHPRRTPEGQPGHGNQSWRHNLPYRRALAPTELAACHEISAGIETNVEEIRSAVLSLPSSAISDELPWTRLAMALAHEARIFPEQSEALWSILDTASKKAGNYDLEKNRSRWLRYMKDSGAIDKPVTIASVFDLAKKQGWPGAAPIGVPVSNSTQTFHPGAESGRNKFSPIFACDFAKLPEPVFVVDGIIPDCAITVIYGPSSSFKSFIALEIAASVAAGVPSFGRFPVTQGHVVFAAGEAFNAVARKRWPAWAHGHGIENDAAGFALVSAVPIVSDPTEIPSFVATMKAAGLRAKVVVFDTVARAMVGMDENDARAAGLMIQAAESIVRELGCAVILVHHSGKDETKGMRGSSALFAGVDAVFKVKRTQDALAVSLTCEKMKDADEPEIIHLIGKPVQNSLFFSAVTASEYVQVSRANPPLSTSEVGAALQAAGAFGGAKIDTHALATALTPLANKDPKAIMAMKKRLQRGAKGPLAAYVVQGTGGRGNPHRWTFPALLQPSNMP